MKARLLLSGMLAVALLATPAQADSPDEKMCHRAGDLDISQDTVVAACARAVRRVKQDDRALLYLRSAKAASIGGDFDRAFSDIALSIRNYGTSKDIGVEGRADIWFRKNELDRAVEDYNEVIRNDRADGTAILKRNFVFARLGDLRRVISGASEYMSQTNLAYAKSVLIQRALGYYYTGSPAQALADLKRSIEMDPKEWIAPDALFWHEIIASRHGLPPLPDHLKRAVIQNAPKELAIRLLAGQATKADIEAEATQGAGKPSEYRKVWHSCHAHYFGGLWALRNGQQQDAIGYLRRAQEDCTRDPDLDYLRNWRSWIPGVTVKALLEPASAVPSDAPASSASNPQQSPRSAPPAGSVPPSGKMDNNFSTADGDRGDAGRSDYELAERIGTKAAWEAYLARNPSGFYADLARAQLEKLGVQGPGAQPAAR